jgi:hypothetical protein
MAEAPLGSKQPVAETGLVDASGVEEAEKAAAAEAAEQEEQEEDLRGEMATSMQCALHVEQAAQQPDLPVEAGQSVAPQASQADTMPAVPKPSPSLSPSPQPQHEPHSAQPQRIEPSLTPAAVAAMAEYLGIDATIDWDLLWLARDCLVEPLPPGWEEHFSPEGEPQFVELASGEVHDAHPSDVYFREALREIKRQENRERSPDSAWMTFPATEQRGTFAFNWRTGERADHAGGGSDARADHKLNASATSNAGERALSPVNQAVAKQVPRASPPPTASESDFTDTDDEVRSLHASGLREGKVRRQIADLESRLASMAQSEYVPTDDELEELTEELGSLRAQLDKAAPVQEKSTSSSSSPDGSADDMDGIYLVDSGAGNAALNATAEEAATQRGEHTQREGTLLPSGGLDAAPGVRSWPSHTMWWIVVPCLVAGVALWLSGPTIFGVRHTEVVTLPPATPAASVTNVAHIEAPDLAAASLNRTLKAESTLATPESGTTEEAMTAVRAVDEDPADVAARMAATKLKEEQAKMLAAKRAIEALAAAKKTEAAQKASAAAAATAAAAAAVKEEEAVQHIGSNVGQSVGERHAEAASPIVRNEGARDRGGAGIAADSVAALDGSIPILGMPVKFDTASGAATRNSVSSIDQDPADVAARMAATKLKEEQAKMLAAKRAMEALAAAKKKEAAQKASAAAAAAAAKQVDEAEVAQGTGEKVDGSDNSAVADGDSGSSSLAMGAAEADRAATAVDDTTHIDGGLAADNDVAAQLTASIAAAAAEQQAKVLAAKQSMGALASVKELHSGTSTQNESTIEIPTLQSSQTPTQTPSTPTITGHVNASAGTTVLEIPRLSILDPTTTRRPVSEQQELATVAEAENAAGGMQPAQVPTGLTYVAAERDVEEVSASGRHTPVAESTKGVTTQYADTEQAEGWEEQREDVATSPSEQAETVLPHEVDAPVAALEMHVEGPGGNAASQPTGHAQASAVGDSMNATKGNAEAGKSAVVPAEQAHPERGVEELEPSNALPEAPEHAAAGESSPPPDVKESPPQRTTEEEAAWQQLLAIEAAEALELEEELNHKTAAADNGAVRDPPASTVTQVDDPSPEKGAEASDHVVADLITAATVADAVNVEGSIASSESHGSPSGPIATAEKFPSAQSAGQHGQDQKSIAAPAHAAPRDEIAIRGDPLEPQDSEAALPPSLLSQQEELGELPMEVKTRNDVAQAAGAHDLGADGGGADSGAMVEGRAGDTEGHAGTDAAGSSHDKDIITLQSDAMPDSGLLYREPPDPLMEDTASTATVLTQAHKKVESMESHSGQIGEELVSAAHPGSTQVTLGDQTGSETGRPAEPASVVVQKSAAEVESDGKTSAGTVVEGAVGANEPQQGTQVPALVFPSDSVEHHVQGATRKTAVEKPKISAAAALLAAAAAAKERHEVAEHHSRGAGVAGGGTQTINLAEVVTAQRQQLVNGGTNAHRTRTNEHHELPVISTGNADEQTKAPPKVDALADVKRTVEARQESLADNSGATSSQEEAELGRSTLQRVAMSNRARLAARQRRLKGVL